MNCIVINDSDCLCRTALIYIQRTKLIDCAIVFASIEINQISIWSSKAIRRCLLVLLLLFLSCTRILVYIYIYIRNWCDTHDHGFVCIAHIYAYTAIRSNVCAFNRCRQNDEKKNKKRAVDVSVCIFFHFFVWIQFNMVSAKSAMRSVISTKWFLARNSIMRND